MLSSEKRESAFQTILNKMIKGEWQVSPELAAKLQDRKYLDSPCPRTPEDLLDGHETVNKPIKSTMPISMSDD